jgi:proteasome activator subunit 4
VPVEDPSDDYTSRALASYKSTLDFQRAAEVPLLKDHMKSGWLVWASTDERYLMPLPDQYTFQPWEAESIDAVRVVEHTCCKEAFWRSIVTYFAEETNEETLTLHNISATKSICTSFHFRAILFIPDP